MTGLYDYTTVTLFADEIVNHIGEKNFYTDKNFKYLNAPSNYLLNDPETFIHFIKSYFEILGTPKNIHIIPRNNVEVVLGMYVNMPHDIYVSINNKMNDCWRRFTIIKELCSAYVGHYQDENNASGWITNEMFKTSIEYVGSVEDAFEGKMKYVNNNGLDEGDFDSETFSILLATELMIPRPFRDRTQEMIRQVENNHLTLNDVAKSLLIPESVLRLHIKNGYL